MVEKMKKSLVAAIIVLMLLPTQLLQVFAVSEGDNPYLKRGSLGDYTVQFDAGGYWVYSKEGLKIGSGRHQITGKRSGGCIKG